MKTEFSSSAYNKMNSFEQYARIPPMETEKRQRSPEELQALTVRTYEHIPQTRSIESFFHDLSQQGLSNEEISERLLKEGERISSSILVERFKELIANSPTTESFKKVFEELVQRVCGEGRASEEFVPEDDAALREVLQLEDSTGIYAPRGAKKGEHVLFGYLLDSFAENIKIAVEDGLDPFSPDNFDPFGPENLRVPSIFTGSILELRDFLLEWGKEFKNLYGRSIGNPFLPTE